MKRYAYIEPTFNQLLFNETFGWLRPIRDKIKWIEQGKDESETVRAIEKKYKIKLELKDITDNQGHKWKGYVIKEVLK